MSSISIIGLGGMARAIGARAVEGGNAVEVTGRDAAKAKDLAAALGGGATAGTFGTAPAGDIVILAVPYTSAVPVVFSIRLGGRGPEFTSSESRPTWEDGAMACRARPRPGTARAPSRWAGHVSSCRPAAAW